MVQKFNPDPLVLCLQDEKFGMIMGSLVYI